MERKMYAVTRVLNRLIEFVVGTKAVDRAKEIIHTVKSHNEQEWVKEHDRYYRGRECPRCHKSNIVNTIPVASGGIFGGTTDYFKCNDCNNVWGAHDSWNNHKKYKWEELEKHWIKEVDGEYRYYFIKDWMIFILFILLVLLFFLAIPFINSIKFGSSKKQSHFPN